MASLHRAFTNSKKLINSKEKSFCRPLPDRGCLLRMLPVMVLNILDFSLHRLHEYIIYPNRKTLENSFWNLILHSVPSWPNAITLGGVPAVQLKKDYSELSWGQDLLLLQIRPVLYPDPSTADSLLGMTFEPVWLYFLDSLCFFSNMPESEFILASRIQFHRALDCLYLDFRLPLPVVVLCLSLTRTWLGCQPIWEWEKLRFSSGLCRMLKGIDK